MTPSFSKTGLHLDLRIQVPPMPALRRLAREVAEQGHNVLVMEWEATFPFERHAILSNRYAYTRDEVASLIEDCAGWGLEVIPLQQCFGHVDYILRHPRYAPLRESDTDLYQICPCRVDEAMEVFSEIFREVASLHPSPLLHIGGDETRLLGHCPDCRRRADAEGISGLYVGYLKRAAAEVLKLGKRPMLWIDMLLKHPAAAAEMPRECVFVDWNYGWDPNLFGDFSSLASLPFEFWGAAAMRSWHDNHSGLSWRGHFENLRDYIPEARRRKFQGMLLTSWSTSGSGSFEWEGPGRPQAFFPMRRRMPHAGLPIFIAAFAEAIHQAGPLDYEDFTVRYARRQFGFSAADARDFLRALLLADQPSREGLTLRENHRRAQEAAAIFVRLQPVKGTREYERYDLMISLTEHYLRSRLVEEEAQMADERTRASLVEKIRELLGEAEVHSDRFLKAYEGELHPAELQAEADYRTGNLRELHARLSRSGRSSALAPTTEKSAPKQSEKNFSK